MSEPFRALASLAVIAACVLYGQAPLQRAINRLPRPLHRLAAWLDLT